jgi:hypothetical protein
MKELYPEGNYTLSGEALKSSKKNQERFEKQQQKRREKGKTERESAKIGDLHIGSDVMSVYPSGSNDKLLHKTEGFISVGEGEFIALQASRVPFLLAILGFIIVAVACLMILIAMKNRPPVIIEPDHPLPDPDENVVPVPDDVGTPTVSENGGGAVTMIYTLEATVDLSSGDVGIYLRNPKASNHDVAIKMYILSGDKEYCVASSGLIKAGNGLYKLTLSEDAPVLKEGVYSGYYKIIYYNPQTGERALVEADIKDVNITVTE